MEFTLLDTNFVRVKPIEKYESFIWTDRFCGYGDFEMYTPYSDEVIQDMVPGMYISNDLSDRLMIIENVKIETSGEDGEFISITGRSLESILDRRIVWQQTDLDNVLLVNAIQRLLNESILAPAISARKISNFIYRSPTNTNVKKIVISKQWTGDSVYDAIVDLLEEQGLGFKIVVDSRKRFVMSILVSANKKSLVRFSYDDNNMFNSSYVKSYEDYRNVVLVGGEGQGAERIMTAVGSGSGLGRREMFHNASSVRKTEGMADATYLNLLAAEGRVELKLHKVLHEFEAEVDHEKSYIYGVDYGVGDIVTFVNKWRSKVNVRIDEIIFSNDRNGKYIYPTFVIL